MKTNLDYFIAPKKQRPQLRLIQLQNQIFRQYVHLMKLPQTLILMSVHRKLLIRRLQKLKFLKSWKQGFVNLKVPHIINVSYVRLEMTIVIKTCNFDKLIYPQEKCKTFIISTICGHYLCEDCWITVSVSICVYKQAELN